MRSESVTRLVFWMVDAALAVLSSWRLDAEP
jgi:hypothetical protein